MSKQRGKFWMKGFIVSALVALVGGVILGLHGWAVDTNKHAKVKDCVEDCPDAGKSPSSSSSSSDNAGGDTQAPPEPSATTIAALTVHTTSVKCTDFVGSKNVVSQQATDENGNLETYQVVKYDVGAKKNVPPRKWSTALSTPLNGTTPTAQRNTVQATTCVDPLYGVTVAHMYAGLQVGHTSVLSLNPWLQPYVDATKINDVAASFTPLMGVDNPSNELVASAIDKNVEWQQVAENIDTLVSRFAVTGDQARASVLNWDLVAGGLTAGQLPEVGLNPLPDKLPALVLSLTQKGACAPLKVIGFNLGDKRPEVFATPVCHGKSTPSSSSTSSTSPNCTSNCSSTPGSSCTSNCSHTSTCTPTPGIESCGKHASFAPTDVTKTPACKQGTHTDLDTGKCVNNASSTSGSGNNNSGQGDSGVGATNTTTAPSTHTSAPAPSTTTAPTTNPPKP